MSLQHVLVWSEEPFPVSTAKAFFHAGQGLGIVVERRQLPGVPNAVIGEERPATALTASGRMVSTPRSDRPGTTGSAQARSGRHGLFELPWGGAAPGTPRPMPPRGGALHSFRGRLLTPSHRPPAGA
ncbi:hypothetical protein AK812_SmicGene16178 [Symbiodinium microadriaticum]|uniref:Uncharacterized protein n=1 Tax=Symbiodinium microadriaticum TaxID=2951 RepID=A0A1Q9E128_SYMMI|nr:hypothetical protein AK812_SmicGene16178 [Symbiodinium microadriaticum]